MKYLGIHFRRMKGADKKWCLTAVVWYPRSRRELGYFYPSIHWF